MNFLFTCTANLDVACTSGQSGHPCANATSLLAAASTLKDSLAAASGTKVTVESLCTSAG